MSSYESGVGMPDSSEEEEYWLRLLSDLGSEPSVPLSMRPSPSTPRDEGFQRNEGPIENNQKGELQNGLEMTSSLHRSSNNSAVPIQPNSPIRNSNTVSSASPMKQLASHMESIGIDTQLNIKSRQTYDVQRDGIAGVSAFNGKYESPRILTPTYPPPPPPTSRNVYDSPPERTTVEMISTIDLDEEKPRELPDMWGESDDYISDQIDFIFCSDNMSDYEDPYNNGSERMDTLALCRSSLVQLQPVLRNAVGYAANAGMALYASTAATLGNNNLTTSKDIATKLNTSNSRGEVLQDRLPYQGPSLGSLHQTILFLSRHLDSAALGKVVMTASGTVVTLRDIAVMHIARYVRSNVYLSSFVGCVHESTLFMVDRLRAGVELYSHILQGDDPEKMHLELLKDKPDWQHLLLRCSMASLTWKQRQLLEETRDGGSINSADFRRLVQAQILEFDRQRVAKVATEYFYITPGTDLSSARSVKPPLALPPAQQITALEEGAAVNALALKSILTDTASIDQLSTDRVDNSQALDVLKSNIHSWLVEEATLGDEDAQYALARFFTPPGFQEGPQCVICDRLFSITLFRHHCRFCGRSVCDDHSTARRCIYRYGLVTPVRVCAQCADSIDETHRMDGIIWRDLRISAYLRNKLIPYFNPAVDRGIDKVFRIADYSMTVARNALTYNFPAKLALDTVEVLKRYGLTGFTGLLLRKDFMESVEMLKRISGMESMFSLSLHELTACVYYKLAIERGLRGSNPDSELLAHAPRARKRSSDGNNSDGSAGRNKTESKPSAGAAAGDVGDDGDYECRDASEADVQLSIRFAPLALNIIYEENPVDCQRLAKLQGWDTIFTNVETDLAPEQPCYTLFGSSFPDQGDVTGSAELAKECAPSDNSVESRLGTTFVTGRVAAKCEASRAKSASTGISAEKATEVPLRKPAVLEAVLVIRGTQTIQDVVTDIRAAPLVFPPPAEEVDAALRGTSGTSGGHGLTMPEGQNRPSQTSPEKGDVAAEKESRWDWLAVPSHHTYACGGMVRAAMYVLREVGPALRRLHAEGYKITIVGHSLGGAVAALLTYMLQSAVPSVNCVTYGCPSCVDAATSDMMRSRVLSVVLHDDCISRITPQSIRLLMRELMVFREQMFQHLQQEWVDVLKRASGLWTPRWRIAAAPPSAERLVSAARNSGAVASMVTGQQPSKSVNPAAARPLVEQSAEQDMFSEAPESSGHDANSNNNTSTADAAAAIMVEEEKLTQLWLPGRVVHIYVHNGQCRAAEVSRDFPDLRVIVLQGNIFEDHRSERMLNALLEVRAVRQAPRAAPAWQSYDAADTCACCHNSFTWNSTFTGQAQEFRDKYNCRYCGHLVCDACSTQRRAMPKIGHMFPRRICDQCLYKGDFATI